ncbi:MAG: hypothetical protein RL497_2522 [Pseudomonadota bacterium]|jgi:hypothetical protein
MSQLDIFRLHFGLVGNKIKLETIDELRAPPPSGVPHPAEPVATGIIGFWVDVQDARQQTIYRRFINKGLPINADFTCRDWSQLRRKKFRVSVEIPVLYRAHSVVLFEQYLASPTDKALQRRKHLTAFLPQKGVSSYAV